MKEKKGKLHFGVIFFEWEITAMSKLSSKSIQKEQINR